MNHLEALTAVARASADAAQSLRHLAETAKGPDITKDALAAQMHDLADLLEKQVAVAQGQVPPPPRRIRPGMTQPIKPPAA